MLEKLKNGNTVSRKSAARDDRPSDSTSTKNEKIRQINAENRTLTIDLFSLKLVEVGLVAGSSKLQRWLKAMGTTRVKRHITPSLSFTHWKNWVDFILDQASERCATYQSGYRTSDVDESWSYLIHDGKRVRTFPGEESVGSIEV